MEQPTPHVLLVAATILYGSSIYEQGSLEQHAKNWACLAKSTSRIASTLAYCLSLTLHLALVAPVAETPLRESYIFARRSQGPCTPNWSLSSIQSVSFSVSGRGSYSPLATASLLAPSEKGCLSFLCLSRTLGSEDDREQTHGRRRRRGTSFASIEAYMYPSTLVPPVDLVRCGTNCEGWRTLRSLELRSSAKVSSAMTTIPCFVMTGSK